MVRAGLNVRWSKWSARGLSDSLARLQGLCNTQLSGYPDSLKAALSDYPYDEAW